MKKTRQTKFPVARIKKIMQTDEDVGKVAMATPVLVSKALELFMANIVEAAVKEARETGGKKLTAYHLKRCVQKDSMYDWLMDTVSSIPDPVEPVAKEKKPRAPRAKKAKAEGVEGEDGGDDKPKPKRRKKAAPAAAAEEEEEEKGTMEAVVEPTKPAGEDDDEYDE